MVFTRHNAIYRRIYKSFAFLQEFVLERCFFLLVVQLFQPTIAQELLCFRTQSGCAGNHKTGILLWWKKKKSHNISQPPGEDSAQSLWGCWPFHVLCTEASCCRLHRCCWCRACAAQCIVTPPWARIWTWDPHTYWQIPLALGLPNLNFEFKVSRGGIFLQVALFRQAKRY